MRRGDGIALRVLIRIISIVAIVLRRRKRCLGWSVIFRLRWRDRLVGAARLVLRDRYRLVIGGSAVTREK